MSLSLLTELIFLRSQGIFNLVLSPKKDATVVFSSKVKVQTELRKCLVGNRSEFLHLPTFFFQIKGVTKMPLVYFHVYLPVYMSFLRATGKTATSHEFPLLLHVIHGQFRIPVDGE